MTKSLNRYFFTILLIGFVGLLALPVLADEDDDSMMPQRERVEMRERMEVEDGSMADRMMEVRDRFENRVETFRVDLTKIEDPEIRQKLEEKRTEMETRREELQAKAEERRAEIEQKAEERRAQIEEKRAEMTQKRVEFQKEIAEKRLENTSKVTLATIERLEGIADRIQSRIEKVAEAGNDTTESEAYLNAARVDLEAARTNVADFENLDLTSDDAQANFELIKVSAKEAKDHIRSAHENLKNAVQPLSFGQNDQSSDDSSEETNN